MITSLIIYIIIAAIISLIFAAIMYLYKNKNATYTKYGLFFLRFLSLFSLLLLLINPKFKKQLITTEKPSLVVLLDNSKSIKKLKQQGYVSDIVTKLKEHKLLSKKFKFDFHSFSDDLKSNDTLNFEANETNIYETLKSTNKLYKKRVAPIVLVSDGNQTAGMAYNQYKIEQQVFPIIVGDTTRYKDIKITQLNVNKYAYLKHKFPVEVFIVYDGNDDVAVKFTIDEGRRNVFSKSISLSKTKKVTQLSFHLPANSVGVHSYEARISYLENEKNKFNNKKNFTVEVINEKSKILLVSDISHPDIAMFKRAIGSNKQRKIIVKKSTDAISLRDYQMVILYQPTANFNAIFSKINEVNKNFFVITGSKTNWHTLNEQQHYFSKKAIQKTEDYLGSYNVNYNTFLIQDIGFLNFSPLTDFFGDITFSIPYDTLLFQQIGSFSSKHPLLATFEYNSRRGAVLFGEHSWRWRMNSQIEKKTFQDYDEFVNKIIQYLASNKRSNLLDVSNKPYFYANEEVKINAQFYDANYEFDAEAKLWITIYNKLSKKQKKYPLALHGNTFGISINDLETGSYTYKVADEFNKSEATGSFNILDYNMEEKFVTANKKDLLELAHANDGKVFYFDQVNLLIDSLVNNDRFVAVQKTKEKITPLIDWKWLLGVIALSLSIEWFVRKFKGYI